MSEVKAPEASPKALPPENYLTESRRSRISEAVKNKIRSVETKVAKRRDRFLKKEYARLAKTPAAAAVRLGKKHAALTESVNEAAKARAKRELAARTVWAKACAKANKAYEKAVAKANKLKAAAEKAASRTYERATRRSIEASEKALESLKEAGYAVDMTSKKGVRPLYRTGSKDERLLGGPLAKKANDEAETRLEALSDLRDDVDIAVQLDGTSLESQLKQIGQAVDEIAKA